MAGQAVQEIRDALKLYGRRLIDVLYHVSAFSIIAYGAALFVLFVLGWAIANNIIHVPVFHPDIPVTSGSS